MELGTKIRGLSSNTTNSCYSYQIFRDFLTDTFTTYYRLLITHLGLLQWQYALPSYGISPQAKQWFSMCKPITYNTDLLAEETSFLVNKPGSQQSIQEQE